MFRGVMTRFVFVTSVFRVRVLPLPCPVKAGTRASPPAAARPRRISQKKETADE